MVRFLLIPALLVTFSLFSVNIKVEMDPHPHEDLDKVSGTIIITHNPNETIKSSAFSLNQKKLPVELLEKEPLGEETVVSSYRFNIPNPGEGTHLLPSISVFIGDKQFETPAMNYELSEDFDFGPLKMKAEIIKTNDLYPGMRFLAQYKIFFRGNVQLSREELPLLDPEDFTKIGSLRTEETTMGGYNIQIITQELEALRPGIFRFNPSIMEGTVFIDANNKVPVSSKTPSFNLVVLPFPDEGKPPSFNGTLGSYTLSSQLIGTPNTIAGDTLELELRFTGYGPLHTVYFPTLSCQPGFSGFFAFSDLPPSTVTNENQKIFRTQLRPLSSTVTQIPPIYFSSFDPISKKYIKIKSAPIPLKIQPLAPDLEPFQDNQKPLQSTLVSHPTVDWKNALRSAPLTDIEIDSSIPALTPPSLWHRHPILLTLLFVISSLIATKIFGSSQSPKKSSSPLSHNYLKQALQAKEDPLPLFLLAITARLEELPPSSKDREPLLHYRNLIEKQRYGRKTTLDSETRKQLIALLQKRLEDHA